jgi:hypothetical protein
MFYYIIDNRIISQAAEFDSRYYNYTKLTEQQTAFYLANATASVSEVLAMELNPIPEPQEPTEPEPTIEERVETNEDALDELIQYVYGGA